MNTVTFMGNLLHLEGNLPAVGQKAPEFTVCNNGLEPRSLKDYAGKIVVLVSVPSLDTPVCDMEVRRFNKEAAALSDKVQILALSCDLPFAQARWCGAAGVQAVESLSDYKDVDFGKNYGVLIQELRLLARAIFVVAPDGTLAYSQLVPEVTNEPDYDAVLDAVKKLAELFLPLLRCFRAPLGEPFLLYASASVFLFPGGCRQRKACASAQGACCGTHTQRKTRKRRTGHGYGTA